MKYLEIRESEKIPDSAAAIYQRYDTLWKFVTNLDTTVKLYNKVRTSVLEVEFPLIEGQLAEIDSKLQQAETSLNWNTDGMFDTKFATAVLDTLQAVVLIYTPANEGVYGSHHDVGTTNTDEP